MKKRTLIGGLRGLTSQEVQRLVANVKTVAKVVGLTIAEFIPRQVIRLQQVLRNFPLIQDPTKQLLAQATNRTML